MNKVLVEIICPATSKSYEFWIPKDIEVKRAARRIADDIMLYEMNDELFLEENGICLYLYENRYLLNPEYTIEQSGVSSGTRVMII